MNIHPRQNSSGVPKWSVLGPVPFTRYLLSLCEILRELVVKFHWYDDTQLYIPFYFDDYTCVSDISGYNSLLGDIKLTES